MKIPFLLVIIIITNYSVKSQNLKVDSIYGKIKRVREKVIYLNFTEDPSEENDDFSYYSDSMILFPNSLNSYIFDHWLSGKGTSYNNYEQNYDENGNLLKQTWFGKRDTFYKSETYIYDDKNRIISEIDSSINYSTTVKHIYEDFDNYSVENIISLNLKSNSFYHYINYYKDKKKIRAKNIDEYGNITEYINKYNEKGRLKFSIIKDPNSWIKHEDGGWSHGIQDTLTEIYKHKSVVYDEKNRILKELSFGFSKKNDYQEPIINHQVLYTYEKNKISVKTIYSSGMISNKIYLYDNANRIIASYCCNENSNEAGIIKKYTYKNNIINTFYLNEDATDKRNNKEYKITFSYKFDDHKNWIEIVKNVNGINEIKRTREIEYY